MAENQELTGEDVEEQWRQWRVKDQHKIIYFAVVAGCIGNAIFHFVDKQYVAGETLNSATWTRVVVVAALVIEAALCRVPGFVRLAPHAVVLTAAGGISFVIAFLEGRGVGYEISIVLAMLTYSLVMATSRRATCLTLSAIVFVHVAVSFFLGGEGFDQSQVANLIIAWGIGMGIAWIINGYRRRDFIHGIEQQSLVRRLQQADAEKEAIFANVNHELRTPLTLIISTARGLAAAPPGEPPNAKRLDMLLENALRLMGMVDDMLRISSLNAQTLVLRRRRVDIVALIKKFLSEMQYYLEGRKIRIMYEGPDALEVLADYEAMRKVMNNLVTNAFKFTKSGGTVTVGVVDGDPVKVYVADTGLGIPDEDRPKMFKRFSQGSGGKALRKGGVGIGLAMCKQIVELHGGTLDYESKVNVGTKMFFVLPKNLHLEETERATFSDKTGEHAGLKLWIDEIRENPEYEFRSVKDATEQRAVPRSDNEEDLPFSILIVEDNPQILQLLNEMFLGKYKVRVATNGEEGLERARRFLPNVILSDVEMPKMDGYQLLKAVREDPKLKDVHFALITARGAAKDRLLGTQLEADGYIAKPFDEAEILQMVQNFVKRQSLQAAQATDATSRSNRILLSQIAHDINNPVTIILQAVAVMDDARAVLMDPAAAETRKQVAGDRFARALGKVGRNCGIIEKVVLHLYNVAHGIDEPPAPVDVNEVVRRVVAALSETKQVEPDLHATHAALLRPGHLDRALFNLVINALEAGGPGGSVRVVTGDLPHNGMVRIEVFDDGPGMDEQTLAKLGSPGFSTKAKGQGLGTTMCKTFVAEHNGKMSIVSELGTGTCFTIDLPAASRADLGAPAGMSS